MNFRRYSRESPLAPFTLHVYTWGMSKILHTVDDVIAAFGKPSALARLSGRPPQAVSNWRRAGKLPKELILIHREELERLGFVASPALWGVEVPAKQQEPAQ